MSTHCCFRRLAPILRCSNASGFARVAKLGQWPQTLDAVRAHVDQSPAQLLEPTRADLAKPTDATLLRAGFALSRPTRCQCAHTREKVRTGRCQSVSNSCCSDAESLSLKPDARAPSPADFRQIDQSSVRETAPNRRKPFPYAMAVNSNFKKTCIGRLRQICTGWLEQAVLGFGQDEPAQRQEFDATLLRAGFALSRPTRCQ